jgi:hypothetical protein
MFVILQLYSRLHLRGGRNGKREWEKIYFSLSSKLLKRARSVTVSTNKEKMASLATRTVEKKHASREEEREWRHVCCSGRMVALTCSTLIPSISVLSFYVRRNNDKIPYARKLLLKPFGLKLITWIDYFQSNDHKYQPNFGSLTYSRAMNRALYSP